jgi:FkbM family methyltransferase
MDPQSNQSPWGSYAPSFTAKLLRLPVKLGLGHGKLKDLILARWIKQYGSDVDIIVRGIKYRLNVSDNVTDGRLLVSSRVYDKTEIDVLKRFCQGGVFVDIGANIGYYTLAMAFNGAQRVVAIEPNPPALSRLRFNIDINDMQDVISVVPIGVGEAGEFKLSLAGGLGGASLVMPEDAQGSVTITTKPLIEILEHQGIDEIAAMKIDIEGFEDRALMPFFETAPRTMWPHCIVMEDCHRQHWQADITAKLLRMGYRQIGKTRGNVILEIGQ